MVIISFLLFLSFESNKMTEVNAFSLNPFQNYKNINEFKLSLNVLCEDWDRSNGAQFQVKFKLQCENVHITLCESI